MACFTPLPALLCPPKDPFAPPTGAVVPVVYDTETEETRPLANGESFPGYQCVEVDIANGEFPPTNQLLNIYRDLQSRIKELERKFCDCLCVDPDCPDCPDTPVLRTVSVYSCGYNPEQPGQTPEELGYVDLYAVPSVGTGGGIGILITMSTFPGVLVNQDAYAQDWTFMSGDVNGSYTSLGTASVGVDSLTTFASITHLNVIGGPCEGT